MRHTPLRQAFNALKKLKNLQLQGGGGAIEESAVKEYLKESIYVSAESELNKKFYPEERFVNKPLKEGSLELKLNANYSIGILEWTVVTVSTQGTDDDHINFTFTPTQDYETKAHTVSPQGGSIRNGEGGKIHIDVVSCPWIKKKGFTSFYFAYTYTGKNKSNLLPGMKKGKFNVNVSCSIPDLASKINAAFKATLEEVQIEQEQQKRWDEQVEKRKEEVEAMRKKENKAAER